jgi:hypothetical protein
MIQINNAPLIISDKKPKYREGKLLAYWLGDKDWQKRRSVISEYLR